MSTQKSSVDQWDAQILQLVHDEPKISILEIARRLGVARGTAQSRLDRLHQRGVVRGIRPEIDVAALGFPVTAFCTLEIQQGVGHQAFAEHLQRIPEVLEAHTITGSGDLLVRLAARSNQDLQRVIDMMVAGPEVIRTSSVIALQAHIPLRTMPLVHAATCTPANATGRAD